MSRREKEVNGKMAKVKELLGFFAPYWILSFIMVFIAFALVAIVFLITPLSQSTFPFISSFVFIAVELLVSYLLGKYCKMPAILLGGLYGAGMAVIMLFVGLVTASISLFSLKFLFMLITGILVGAFGAIAGFNAKPKRKQTRYIAK